MPTPPKPPKTQKVLEPAGFQLSNGSSFKITFPNGYRVVVCFGTSHYCDNYVQEWRDPATMHATDAAAASKGCCNGAVYTYDNTRKSDAVKTLDGLDDATWCHKFQTPMQYLDILNKVAAIPADAPPPKVVVLPELPN